MRAESKPPVINFEVLLKPISEDNPSGEDMKYSGLYDEIRQARRQDEIPAEDGSIKLADYRKIIEIALPALVSETKDLQVTAWLVEALTREHGFVGLRDGLRLMRRLHEEFWETMHPQLEEGDMEARANAVEWVGNQVGVYIRTLPITAGQGFSYAQWEESKKFNIPDDIESLDYSERERALALKKQAEEEKRITSAMWRVAKNQTRRSFYEDLSFLLEECWMEYQNLESLIGEKYDRNQTPNLRELQKSLDDIRTLAKNLLEEKRAEEPDEVETVQEMSAQEDATTKVKVVSGSTGSIQNRQDALRRLMEVAEYFRKNEPHSPVSYLVQRAIKWGHMPLEAWLEDVIKDETVIYQIKQTLGFNTRDSYESKSEE